MDTVYYLAIGGHQDGPYTQTDIQRRLGEGSITPDTLVWHHGLTSWVALSSIEAFGGSRTAPPPVPPSIVTPPIPTQRHDNVETLRRPRRLFGQRLAWIVAGIVILFVGAVLIVRLDAVHDENAALRSAAARIPEPPKSPRPLVVEHTGEGRYQGFEYVAVVKGTVRNKGVGGYVIIRAEVNQGDKILRREQRVYMDAEEQRSVRFELDEVDAGSWQYSVTAEPTS